MNKKIELTLDFKVKNCQVDFFLQSVIKVDK